MTKTTIFTALRFALSLAMTGPAHAWPGPVDVVGLASSAHAAALARKAHPHLRNTEHTIQRPPTTRIPDRAEDPLASMHFE